MKIVAMIAQASGVLFRVSAGESAYLPSLAGAYLYSRGDVCRIVLSQGTVPLAPNAGYDFRKDKYIEIKASDLYEPSLSDGAAIRDWLITNVAGSSSLEVWLRETALEVHSVTQVLTDTYSLLGDAIDTTGYTHVGVLITLVPNDSTGVTLQPFLREGGQDIALYQNDNKQVASVPETLYLEIEVGAIRSLVVKAKAEVVGAAAGTIATSINKIWR